MLRRMVSQGSRLHKQTCGPLVVRSGGSQAFTQQKSNFRTSSRLLELSANEYEKLSKKTLEGLCEYFETILEDVENSDVNLSDGVLTVHLGNRELGTYVINKQSPNKQIWLSSPVSGPKRYDYVSSKWVYKHDDCALNTLLTKELRSLLKDSGIDFERCGTV